MFVIDPRWGCGFSMAEEEKTAHKIQDSAFSADRKVSIIRW